MQSCKLLAYDRGMYIHLPVVDMREGPSRASKVVSQALFGERIQLQERMADWDLIVTPDGYTGWIQLGAWVMREGVYPKDLEVTRLSAHIYSSPDTEYGPLLTLPYGSPLQLISSDLRWHQVCLPNGQIAFVQKGDVVPESFDLISFTKKFLGLPYTWGGRSSFGFDCSGFVQMVYGRMGILLPRDAREQILTGQETEVPTLGDLIFWGKSKQDIRHVGICLGGTQFIHASARENRPYLRVSQLTDEAWSGDDCYPYRASIQKKSMAAAILAPMSMKIR